jgi:hypothetical protein
MLIISKIGACQKLSQKNDLAGVLREMLDNMRDRLQHSNVVALRGDAFGQPDGWGLTDDAGGFRDACLQQLGKLTGSHSAARVKLGVTLAMIRKAGDSGTDPLADVAGKMQHQISDRVLVFGIARPDLLGSEPPKTILDAAVQLFQLVGGELEENLVGSHKTAFTRLRRTSFRESI